MMTDIHPNMPPISLPWFTLLDWAILGVLLLCVIGLFGRWWLCRPKTIPELVKIPVAIPSKDTLRKLKKLIAAEDWKTFCTESSDAFKKLISAQCAADLVEKTTEEIHSWVKQNNIEGKQDIMRFFTLVDPIKYAGAEGQTAMAEKALDIFKAYYQK